MHGGSHTRAHRTVTVTVSVFVSVSGSGSGTGTGRASGVGNDSDSNFYGPELSEVESFNGQICLDSVTTEYLN